MSQTKFPQLSFSTLYDFSIYKILSLKKKNQIKTKLIPTNSLEFFMFSITFRVEENYRQQELSFLAGEETKMESCMKYEWDPVRFM